MRLDDGFEFLPRGDGLEDDGLGLELPPPPPPARSNPLPPSKQKINTNSSNSKASQPHPAPATQTQKNALYISALLDLLNPTSNSSSLSTVPSQPLLKLLFTLIKPPPTIPKYNIYLRRQATQEEFFPRNLKTNPIGYSMIQKSTKEEPTVFDLIKYIAEGVGMPDGAEMIEILGEKPRGAKG